MPLRNGTLMGRLALAACVLVGLVCIFHGHDNRRNAAVHAQYDDEGGEFQWRPHYEVINETEVVWQTPFSPRGVIFVAHGCSHGAVDFWPQSEDCPKCIGLPEEMRITREAVGRNYMVVAISSHDRAMHRCWEHGINGETESSHDIDKVMAVLDFLLKREGLEKVPIYGFGASSGGGFVLHLATYYPLKAICSQIMGVPPAVFARHHANHGARVVKHKYPPTMFVHMPRDAHTATMVQHDMAALKMAGVPTKEIEVLPRPLTPTFLFERCQPEISEQQSVAIFEALKAAGIVDAAGVLTGNPRRLNWPQALYDARVPGLQAMRIKPDESPVSEELNVLYAGHEIVSDTTKEMIDFFEAQAHVCDWCNID